MTADIAAVRETAGVPDLADLPLSALTDSADPALAEAIRLAGSRRAGAGIVYAGFHGPRRRVPEVRDGSRDEAAAEAR
jgi:hypothetical protein